AVVRLVVPGDPERRRQSVDAEARVPDQLLEGTVADQRVVHRLMGEKAETAPAVAGDDRTGQVDVPGQPPGRREGGRAHDDRQVHRQPQEPTWCRSEDFRGQVRAYLPRIALHRITFVAAAGTFHGSSGLVTVT